MNKKTALVSIIIVISIILLVKQFFFSTPVPTDESEVIPPAISMEEILQLVDGKEKPLLMHIYALNKNCPNCDVEFIETELGKIAELEKAYADQIQVIRINIFDYPQNDITQLAAKLELTQAPTTLVISQQEIKGKEIGPISLAETRLLLEEAVQFD